jgi:hypothetical protein
MRKQLQYDGIQRRAQWVQLIRDRITDLDGVRIRENTSVRVSIMERISGWVLSSTWYMYIPQPKVIKRQLESGHMIHSSWHISNI